MCMALYRVKLGLLANPISVEEPNPMLIVSQTHSSPAVKSHSHQEERKVSHILECISDTKENQFSLPQPDEEMDLLKRD